MTDVHSEHGSTTASDPYTIRSYEPGDRGDLRRLLEEVWGSDRSEAWVAYKHETNPYLDGPPMVVAETGGDVVGARPYVPFPLRAGATDLSAVYLNNAMVHPDHRRQGLFTRMTERTVTEFADSTASFLLSLANELSAPGYREQGFVAVGVGPEERRRVQHPGQFVHDRVDFPGGRLAGAAVTVAMQGYLGVQRLGRPMSTQYRVERRPGLPGAELVDLYESDPPTRLHTRRESRLYEWFAEDPYWRYETYLAHSDVSPQTSAPVAAVVVREPTGPTTDRVEIVDAVPVESRSAQPATTALLETVLSEYSAASVVSATGPVLNEQLFPDKLLSRFGFLSSTHPLVARFTATGDTAFVHRFAGTQVDDIAADGVDVTDPTDWQVTIR